MSLAVKSPPPHSHYSGEIFVTVLVGKMKVIYRVIHFTVKSACNPNSLNCMYTKEGMLGL